MKGRTAPARLIEQSDTQPVKLTTLAELLETQDLSELLTTEMPADEAQVVAEELVAAVEADLDPTPEVYWIIQHQGANRHERRARKHRSVGDDESSQRLNRWYTTPNFTIRKRRAA